MSNLTLIERLEMFEQHQVALEDRYGSELLHRAQTHIANLEDQEALVYIRIANLERKLAEKENLNRSFGERIDFLEHNTAEAVDKLAEAREVIKPIADVYAEAHEQRTGPFANRKYDLFTLNEETVRDAAKWYEDNQEK